MENTRVILLLVCVLQIGEAGSNLINDDSGHNRQTRQTTLCGEIVPDTHGTITPPTVDGNYQPHSFCRWVIRAKKDEIIRLSATSFGVEFSTGCTWDYLEVREGADDTSHTIGKYCGYGPLALLSSSDTLVLYFVSDGSFQDRGFQLDYKSIPRETPDLSQCDHLIEGEGLISSPNYPGDYGPYSSCFYWIQAPEEDTQVQLELLDVNLEDSGCIFDYVNIYDGRDSHCPSLLNLCGDTIHSSNVTSTGNQVFITFVSDGYLESKGFQMRIHFIKHEDATITEEENVCRQVYNVSMEGVVTSPGFPGLYPNQATCVTVVMTPVPDHHVQFTLVFLDVEGSTNCTFDSLEIFDGDADDAVSLGKICGHTTQILEYVTTYDTLKLVLTSDYLVSGRGFIGNYTILPNTVSKCSPACQDRSICVEEKGTFRCVLGKRCEYNICDNGDCVLQDGNITCYCTSNFTGMVCNRLVKSSNKQNIETRTRDIHTDMAASRGDRLMINCRTNATETVFTWALNDRLIMGDAGVVEHGNGSLEILAFDDAYTGIYKCLTDSYDAFTQTTFNLTLLEGCSLEMTLSPEDVSVVNGDSATLRCMVEAGIHNITWLKGDEVVFENDEYTISENGTTLVIWSVTGETSGAYTCVADRGGDCEASRTIQVSTMTPRIDNGYCGRPAVPDLMPRMNGRISRGHSVQHASSPWHVILRDRREMMTFCGGTLISKSWLVTAAHCTSNDHFSREFNKSFDASYVDLIIGTDLCNGTGGERRGILRYIPNPRFGQRAPYDNDIALIELDTPVDYSRTIRPICLQSLDTVESVFMNRQHGRTVGRVVGCGRVHERITETPPYLRDVFVPYVDRRFCSHAKIGNGNFTDSMFCAGYNRAYMGDACSGDSGGSLTMQTTENDPWYLVGIVSWGVGCDRPGHYGYYTHVAKFLDWVSRVTHSEFLETF